MTEIRARSAMPSYQTMKSRLEKSEPEFEEDKGELPLKIDCKDNWKFKFRNGGMVYESEVGVRNSSLTMFEFILWSLWLNGSRLNFAYVVVQLIMFIFIGDTFMSTTFILFLIVTYLAILAFEAGSFFYFYFKVKEMESIWDQSSIHKVNSTTHNWSSVEFRKLKVGDLIMLKHGTVAPADVLIIDTSDTHFSEQILNSNERRVTGCNRMTIKRAVKNLRNKNSTKNPHEAIRNMLPMLEGQLEYEAPSERVAHFYGSYKLNNDPQISKINHKNMLFCGTQLHTSWMIGIVLFTGQDTKIIQMNMLQWTKFQRIRKETKISKISVFINWLFVVYTASSLIVAMIFVVQINFASAKVELANWIESEVLGSTHYFKRILMLIQGPLMLVPHLIVLVYEVVCFVYGIIIQRTKQDEQDKMIQEATMNITQATEYAGRRNYKKRSTRLKDTNEQSVTGTDIRKTKSGEEASVNLTGVDSSRNTLISHRRGRGGRPDPNNTNVSASRVRSTGGASGTHNRGKRGTNSDNNHPHFQLDIDQVKVINYEALPDLGSINHVVFDKTDTLTMSTMHVCQLATYSSIYKVEGEVKLRELMELYQTSPQEFEFEEDEEEKKAKENSFYSEKSQEYEKEIAGDYFHLVHCDNSIEILNYVPTPDYNNALHVENAIMRGNSAYSANGGDYSERDNSIHSISKRNSQRGFPLEYQSGVVNGNNPNQSQLHVNSQGPSQPGQDPQNLPKKGIDDSFAELNMLEKQFKKHYKEDAILAASPRGDSPDGDSVDMFYSFRNFTQLKINNDKHLNDKHLVADVMKRSESVEELLTNLFVMHMVEYGPYLHEERYMRPEDEAVFEVVRSLGFYQDKMFKPNDLKQQPDQSIKKLFAFNIETISKLKKQVVVYAMNIYSQNRKRKSMIIGSQSENDPFELIAIGSEKSMKSALRPPRNMKEENLLKILIAKQKQKGLKVLIVARKGLSEDQVFSYTKEYNKISNSARDQIEDLENLAIQMENDMEFVGCLGLRDSIQVEAIKLADEIKRSSLPISIMSGDELENCLTVVQKLQTSDIDIQNSSSFYWIRLSSQRGILQEMRRIFDAVHDTLQNESYLAIDKIMKQEKEDQRGLEESQTLTKQSSRVQIEAVVGGRDLLEKVENLSELITDEEQLNRLKKTLLISGESIDIIMQSTILRQHLCSILFVTRSILAYDLRPKHKTFLIDVMRSTGQVVLAVGDGFNDIGMLARANIGIQLSNSHVPLIFGDIVVPQLKQIAPLLYRHGFTIKKNLLLTYTILINIVTVTLFFPVMTMYYSYHTITFDQKLLNFLIINIVFVLFTVFALVNHPYSSKILALYPALYRENHLITQNIGDIFLIFFLWGIVEGIVMIIPAVLFLSNDLNYQGHAISFEILFIYYLIIQVVGSTAKLILLLSRRNLKSVAKILVTSFLTYTILIMFQRLFNQEALILSGGILPFHSNFMYTVVIVLSVQIYFSAILIESFKKSYFLRSATLLRKFESMSPAQATNSVVLRSILNEQNSGQDVFLELIHKVRQPFRELATMDSALRRIINIDFHNSNMGLGTFSNRIVDEDENRRFLSYLKKSVNQQHLRLLLVGVYFGALFEWIIAVLTKKYTIPLLLATPLPYFILVVLGLLLVQKFKEKFLYTGMLISMCLMILITFCTSLIPGRRFFSSMTLLKRFMSSIHYKSVIIPAYIVNIVLEIIVNIVIAAKSFEFADGLTVLPLQQSSLIWLRVVLGNVLILLLRLISIRKSDRVLKINFLNRIRIKNETSQSQDKMQMLMPDFIIERISNFEISKNFLTDDAGDIAVLFCDICDFDEVIKECEGTVVEIMDEVFRNFDNFCKSNGIQKIETVGKTYMAAGGLKFIESKLMHDAPNNKHFMIRTIDVAKKMMEFTQRYTYRAGKHLKAKIGIHYGSCIFGVLGYHKPQFSLIGDTINTTSRVCTTGAAENIILSQEAFKNVREIENQLIKNMKKKRESFERLQFIKQNEFMKGKGYVDVYILTDKLQQVDVVEKAAQRRMTLKTGSIINNEIDTNKIGSTYKNTFIANQRRTIANQKKSPPINQDMIAIAATAVPNNEDEIKKVDLQIDVLDSESSSVEKTPLRNKVERGTIGPGMLINVIPVDSSRNMDMMTNAQTAGKNSAGDRKLTMSPHMKPRALIKKLEPESVELGVNTPIAPPDNPSGFGAFTKNLTAQKYIRKPEAEASSPKSRSPVHNEIASMVSEESVKPIDDQLPVQQIELALPYNPNQMLAQMKSVTGMPSEGSPSHSKQRASNMGSAISPNMPFMSPDQFLSPVVSPNRSSPLDNNNSVKGNANFSEMAKLSAPGDRSPAASSKQLMNKQASSRPSQDGGFKTKVMIGKKKNVPPPPPPPPEPVQEAALPLQNLKTASLGSGLMAKSNSMRPRMKSTKEEGLGSRRNSLEDLDSDQEVSVNSDKDGDEFDDLNNNDKNNNHKLPTNPRILEGFGKKNKMRYSLTADFSLFIVILDCLFAEIYAFSESRLLRTNGTFRVINYLVIVSLLFVILMKASLGKAWVYKSLIYFLFGCRLIADLLDLFTTYGMDASVATAFQVKSITVRVMIESIFFLSSGLFYPVESLAINIFYFILILILQLIVNRTPLAAYELFELLLYLIFNITETFSHYKFEYESFISVMNANKKSIQYIKFVNRLLPRHIQQTTTFGNKGESYQDVTILFADICGFTAYSSQKASREVVEMLSKLFTEFDMECNRLNLFKLYTIGDCYVVMGFVDKRNRKSPSEEAHDVVQLGISMISIIHRVRKMIKFEQLNMRIGIHTGSKIYGGLIGTDIVRFDLYGPDLVIANKMESNGAEGHINISERTKTLLEELQTVNYTFEENKKIYIKSTDSEIKSYFVRYNE